MMRRVYWVVVPFVIFILLAVFFWRGLSLNPTNVPSVLVGKKVPDTVMYSLFDGHQIQLTNIQGSYLLNVWGSWCAVCFEEQDFLMQLAQQNIPIIGLSYKDSSEPALQFLNQLGNPFLQVGEDKTGKLAMDLGVYGAPETFLIDSNHIIRYRHAGALNETVWKDYFLKYFRVY